MNHQEVSETEKIKYIEESDTLESIPSLYLPPTQSDEYYFVSYSHKDYKDVFKCIYALQRAHIAIWYDRGLRPGKDWEIEAEKHIWDFKCKGIIFFISENSVLSDSIDKEIDYVRKSGKDYLSINLPIRNKSGKNLNGKFFSAQEMLKNILPNLSEDNSKFKIFAETFNSKKLFLKYDSYNNSDAYVSNIIDKIRFLKRPPLFNVNKESDTKYTITSVNDSDIKFLTESDITYYSKKQIEDSPTKYVDETTGEYYFETVIEECAFANCKLLEKVVLPIGFREIKSYAFWGCTSLEDINLQGICAIGDNTFANCYNLRNIKLSEKLFDLGKEAFYNCKNLESIELCNKLNSIKESSFRYCERLKNVNLKNGLKAISACAFANCKCLESIDIPNSVTEIGAMAFFFCKSLTSIKLSNNVQIINHSTFESCENLVDINIPDAVKIIKKDAFNYCTSLKNVKIPLNCNSIEFGAFGNCYKLEKVTIPEKFKESLSYIFINLNLNKIDFTFI